MIKPTVGRVVLFQPQKALEQPPLDQPYAATIAYVWGDRMVNLSWVDHNGRPGASTSVTLLQDDDVGNESGHFAYWMPYQKEQAEKSAAAREQRFKPGDGVRLRSGGPLMVVTAVEGDNVKCCWFCAVEIASASFKAATLDMVIPSDVDVQPEPPVQEAAPVGADSPRSPFRKLRIVSDGQLTRVYDFETGLEVKLVQSLRLEHHKGGRMYARVETLERAESFEIVADSDVRGVEPGAVPAAGPVWCADGERPAAPAMPRADGAAPRVTMEQIDALMGRVFYSVESRPAGSTSTLVHAFLDGQFYLASGHSACVSPENFNADKGAEIAMDRAVRAATDKLWELEGYALYKRQQEQPSVLTIHGTFSDKEMANLQDQMRRANMSGGRSLRADRGASEGLAVV